MSYPPTSNLPSPAHTSAEDSARKATHSASDPALQIYVHQVRAFLEASEDVEIDVETAQDLLGNFPDAGGDVIGNSESRGDLDDDYERENDIDDNADGDSDDVQFADDVELDLSSLYASQVDDWDAQEVKQMMRHLKEKGMVSWVTEYVTRRNIPIPKLLNAFGINLHPDLRTKRQPTLMYFLRVAISRELRLREKLPQYNTVSDVVNLIRASNRIIVLTGAGISVSCGIPDFRSRDGLYASLKDRTDHELDDPQQMFDIQYFRENPSVHLLGPCSTWPASKGVITPGAHSQIYPSNYTPSPCHRFIKLIEDKGKLLRNYTQNIDTLETLAGVSQVLQCHGSFATASCVQCRRRVPGAEIEADILRQKVPICTVCNAAPTASPESMKKGKRRSRKKGKAGWNSDEEDESDVPEFPLGIMKPDITFFGEKLTDDFDRSLAADREKVDLLLVIGTSLKVTPVSEILSHLPHSIPQVLINKTPVTHINPDVVLLGNADQIVQYLCHELGWVLPPPASPPLSATTRLYPARGVTKKRSSDDLPDLQAPQRVGNSHVWLFSGAEGGRWVEKLQREAVAVEGDAGARSPVGSDASQDDDGRQSKKQRVK